MTGYCRKWECEGCGEWQETIDWPRVKLCENCDNATQLSCIGCHKPTTLTPRRLRLTGKLVVAHAQCVALSEQPALAGLRPTEEANKP
jgi:hypothetical protein